MSLASYFTNKKQLKRNKNIPKEDEKKKKKKDDSNLITACTMKDIPKEIVHDVVSKTKKQTNTKDLASPTKDERNDGEKDQEEKTSGFQFNFYHNETNEGEKNDCHNFQFGFEIDTSNGNNNDHDHKSTSNKIKKKKRKKRKKKSHSNNNDQEAGCHENMFNDNNDDQATNNRGAIMMKPQHKEAQRNQKEIDDEEEEDDDDDDSDELNFEAMQSFVQSSKIFNHDTSSSKEKQIIHKESKSPKTKNKNNYPKEIIKNHDNDNKDRIQAKTEITNSKQPKTNNNSKQNTLSNSNDNHNSTSTNAVAAVAAAVAASKRNNTKKNKKPKTQSIQLQAQLQALQEKQLKSIKVQQRQKPSIPDRTLKFNSDKGKAMINRGSLAVHREKSKLMKQHQQQQQEKGVDIGESQKQCNPFSFGFHFNSLLPQASKDVNRQS